MVTTTYDAECLRLARHALNDEKLHSDPELWALHCNDLALLLQRTIDDFMFVRTPLPEESP